MHKITPFLWFNGNAEEAANFYVSIFKDSSVLSITRYGESGPGPKGSVMTVSFKLDGQEFTALNGGPEFSFNPAISFVVNCDTQEEVDEYVSEGVEAAVPYRGRAKEVLMQLVGGIRSGMSYSGAHSIAEFHEKALFVRITSAGWRESLPHDAEVL